MPGNESKIKSGFAFYDKGCLANVSKIQFYKGIMLGQNSKGILKTFTTPYCLPKWQYLRAKIAGGLSHFMTKVA